MTSFLSGTLLSLKNLYVLIIRFLSSPSLLRLGLLLREHLYIGTSVTMLYKINLDLTNQIQTGHKIQSKAPDKRGVQCVNI